MVNVTVELDPNFSSNTSIKPQISFFVYISNKQDEKIDLVYLMAQLLLHNESRTYQFGIAIPESLPDIRSKDRARVRFRLELDQNMISKIEQIRQTTRKGDLRITAIVVGKVAIYQPQKFGDKGVTIPAFSGFDGITQEIKIARSDWENWLNEWGKEIRTISLMDKNLLERLLKLQTEQEISNDFDLMNFLITSTEQNIRADQYANLLVDAITEHDLLSRIHQLLEDVKSTVLIAGWIDGEFLPDLKQASERGVQIKILTKDLESAKPDVKSDISRIGKAVGQDHIRINRDLHDRFLIVDDVCIIGSMHLMSHMKKRFESAIETNYVTIVNQLIEHFKLIWEDAQSKPIKLSRKK